MFFKALFLAAFLALAASENFPLYPQNQNGPQNYGLYLDQLRYFQGPYPTPYQVPYALQYQGYPFQYQGFQFQYPGQYPFQYPWTNGLYPSQYQGQYQGPFTYPFQGPYTYPFQGLYGNQNRFFGFPYYFNQQAAA
ncbi:uncharacterized protein [Halyomorpha halys]|uniref:uncharacterized protein n=1 Tax=Halyomorpha halys TaxID=286706 RepID=UPI0006D4FDD0|nr:calcium-binding protein P-like [Halyomorpha halys]